MEQVHIVHINTIMVAFVLGVTFIFIWLNIMVTNKRNKGNDNQ